MASTRRRPTPATSRPRSSVDDPVSVVVLSSEHLHETIGGEGDAEEDANDGQHTSPAVAGVATTSGGLVDQELALPSLRRLDVRPRGRVGGRKAVDRIAVT